MIKNFLKSSTNQIFLK